MNYAVMAEDLREFMQSHQLSSAYLLGHSMGGKTNVTTRVRPNWFLRANYSQAGNLSQTGTDADVTQRKAAYSKGGSSVFDFNPFF